MENASRALLIAGSVLIAIIIISMFVMMYSRISSMEKIQQEKLELEQLATFNSEFEAFNKKVMYGTDVITLINKVAENNRKYAGNSAYQITIKLDNSFITDSNILIGTDAQQQIFKCTKMEYNNEGRVCNIEIEKAII